MSHETDGGIGVCVAATSSGLASSQQKNSKTHLPLAAGLNGGATSTSHAASSVSVHIALAVDVLPQQPLRLSSR